jgi:holliday junction DNA helicase RuvA
MYNHIDGTVTELTPTYVVLEAGGVGYLINISLNTYSSIQGANKVKLLTHFAVKEDAHTLYGFYTEKERTIFLLLISVNGVGPNTARLILNSLTPDEVATAIMSGNVPVLKGVKGIGEKSAQRIIIDLKDKVGKETSSIAPALIFSSDNRTKSEALSALVNLGFVKNTAEKAIEKAIKTAGPEAAIEELIKVALKNL